MFLFGLSEPKCCRYGRSVGRPSAARVAWAWSRRVQRPVFGRRGPADDLDLRGGDGQPLHQVGLDVFGRGDDASRRMPGAEDIAEPAHHVGPVRREIHRREVVDGRDLGRHAITRRGPGGAVQQVGAGERHGEGSRICCHGLMVSRQRSPLMSTRTGLMLGRPANVSFERADLVEEQELPGRAQRGEGAVGRDGHPADAAGFESGQAVGVDGDAHRDRKRRPLSISSSGGLLKSMPGH